MNALATIPSDAVELTLPPETTIPQWLDLGRDLLTQHRQAGWMLADWAAAGVERFGDQVEFAFLGEQLGVDPKFLTAAVKTAQAFPVSHRDPALSVDHHAHVADLPAEERLVILKRAHTEHWTSRQTRIEVMKLKVATGQTQIFNDDDFEHHELVAICRAFNRARLSVRTEFLEMANAANGEDLDP